MILGGKRIKTPLFAATVADDERLWPWTRGIVPEALLVSYDVLKLDRERTTRPLSQTLQSKGFTIVDSGGYGLSVETDPLAVHTLQVVVRANVGVLLDRIVYATDSRRTQRAAMDWTVRNAVLVKRRHRGRMALEGVIQGATPKQLAESSRRLAELQLPVYGVPVSHQSKYRQYRAALERVAYAASGLPADATLHALGCGSRTLMCILAAVGVSLFDSRSYYQRALYGENLKRVTLCPRGVSRNDKAWRACMERRPLGRTLESRTDHNLFEILKETTRIRCALEAQTMTDYVHRRLTKTEARTIFAALKDLKPLLRSRLLIDV